MLSTPLVRCREALELLLDPRQARVQDVEARFQASLGSDGAYWPGTAVVALPLTKL